MTENTDKFQGKYRIPSARLQNWDYGTDGAYFITICTKNRTHYFGKCEDGKMKLSTEGAIVQGFWHEIPKHFPFVTLGEFIVMPNHIHGVLILDKERHKVESSQESIDTIPKLLIDKTIGQTRLRNQGSDTVSSIIGSYKSICTKHINKTFPTLEFGWQTRFWDNIIKDGQSFENVSQYIINNPLTWENDKFFNDTDL